MKYKSKKVDTNLIIKSSIVKVEPKIEAKPIQPNKSTKTESPKPIQPNKSTKTESPKPIQPNKSTKPNKSNKSTKTEKPKPIQPNKSTKPNKSNKIAKPKPQSKKPIIEKDTKPSLMAFALQSALEKSKDINKKENVLEKVISKAVAKVIPSNENVSELDIYANSLVSEKFINIYRPWWANKPHQKDKAIATDMGWEYDNEIIIPYRNLKDILDKYHKDLYQLIKGKVYYERKNRPVLKKSRL